MKLTGHILLLGIVLLLLVPGVLLSVLLIIAAFGHGISAGFEATDFEAIAIMIAALVMFAYGCCIFRWLYSGYRAAIRRHLLAFYLVLFAYGGMWLLGTASREGATFPIFSSSEKVVGFIVLLVPLCVVLFSRPHNA